MTDQWMPRERWEALVRGVECPLCIEIESNEIANSFGYTVADFEVSRLRLAANQWVTGYCVLICKRHVREPWELNERDRSAFFEDMVRTGQALERVFASVKMNFQILGNAVPHLHCHLIPRYYDDPGPSRPLNPDEECLLLTPVEYEQRVESIRQALIAEVPASRNPKRTTPF